MTVDIKAEFQIEFIEGTFTRTVMVLEETHKTRMIGGVEKVFTTRKMKPVDETYEGGYMVYCPQGHSLFIAADDEEQLKFHGVLRDPKRVDMVSGEEVPEDFNLTPKEIVERKQRNRPRAHTSG